MSGGVRGRRLLVRRWLLSLLVVTGVATVAAQVDAGVASATDAKAGGCIKAHPPKLEKVGQSSAVINVEYSDDCAFPAKVGIKVYRPVHGGFLKEESNPSQSTKGNWKTAQFAVDGLPTDALFRVESWVENFGTDYSSYVEFQTSFNHPSSFVLNARAIRGTRGESDQSVDLDITAGGLSDPPPGTTLVTIDTTLDGRPLDTVTAGLVQCTLQPTECRWTYRLQGVPWGGKLALTATFNNTTYAEAFPNQQKTMTIDLVGGESKQCRATTTKTSCSA